MQTSRKTGLPAPDAAARAPLYFSFPPEKVTMLIGIASILIAMLGFTFAFKRELYGGTPFFPATYFFISERTADLSYVVGSGVRGAWGGAGALFSFLSGEPRAEASARGPARAIPVLTYHRIIGDSREAQEVNTRNFEDQMRKLKAAGWQTITMRDYVDYMEGRKEVPEKSFVITFDDGAKESFYPVDPILRELGFSAVIYVIVASSNIDESVYYLSPQELKRMLKTGRWEIGSHSFDAHHPYPVDGAGTPGNFYADLLWREEDNRLETPGEFRARVREDMERSRRELEETYGIVADTFAFPLGETGAVTAGNFPGGIPITDEEAKRAYAFGFLQTEGSDFTFNYREYPSFHGKRIHVDYDWDGDRLLSIMEGGNPKSLPYIDEFRGHTGWLETWGQVLLGDGFLELKAPEDRTSVESVLDGTALLNAYRYDATLDWREGYALLLSGIQSAEEYRACAFAEGRVQIQAQSGEERTVFASAHDARIHHGEGVRLSMRTNGTAITCFYEGRPVLTFSGLRDRVGGIGIQAWAESPGTAALTLRKVEVTPLP